MSVPSLVLCELFFTQFIDVFFFFSSRRRHTSWPRDWSSDVCSSDLNQRCRRGQLEQDVLPGFLRRQRWFGAKGETIRSKIGRASCRERVSNALLAVA